MINICTDLRLVSIDQTQRSTGWCERNAQEEKTDAEGNKTQVKHVKGGSVRTNFKIKQENTN